MLPVAGALQLTEQLSCSDREFHIVFIMNSAKIFKRKQQERSFHEE
jgi:predicted peroxiredoxin